MIYQSQLELWMIKTGRDADLPKVDPNDETSPMYWGTLLESIVAAHYTKRTGCVDTVFITVFMTPLLL